MIDKLYKQIQEKQGQIAWKETDSIEFACENFITQRSSTCFFSSFLYNIWSASQLRNFFWLFLNMYDNFDFKQYNYPCSLLLGQIASCQEPTLWNGDYLKQLHCLLRRQPFGQAAKF